MIRKKLLYEDDNSKPAGPSEKKRKKISNLPSRKAIHKWVQQFSFLSLRDVKNNKPFLSKKIGNDTTFSARQLQSNL